MQHATPAPKRLITYAAVLQSVLLAGYGLLVLYPAYQSGLAAAPDPTADVAVVPWYEAGSALATAHPLLVRALPLGALALFWCLIPLCSAVLIVTLAVPSAHTLRSTRRRTFIFLVVSWSAIIVTAPAANAFLIWLLD